MPFERVVLQAVVADHDVTIGMLQQGIDGIAAPRPHRNRAPRTARDHDRLVANHRRIAVRAHLLRPRLRRTTISA